MSRGRCSGCGKIGPCRNMLSHVTHCLKYLELFKTSPKLALDPEVDFLEHQRQQRDEDYKFEARMKRIAAKREKDTKEFMSDKEQWATPSDLLDDI